MLRGIAGVVLSLVFAGVAAGQAAGPRNPGFEDGNPGGPPPGWFVPTGAFKAETSDKGAPEGKHAARLWGKTGTANLMQTFAPGELAGKWVEISARVRYTGAPGGRAQLWARVDRPEQMPGLFDNCDDRPVTGPEWTTVTIAGRIDADAVEIALGLLMINGNEAWIDDLTVRETPEPRFADDPARPLSDRGALNVAAFARLYGVVAHFHPADGAQRVNWNYFLAEGVRRVEPAADDAELTAALLELFGPVAPGVAVWRTSDAEPPALERPAGATRMRSVTHIGFAGRLGSLKGPGPGAIYSARVRSRPIDADRPDDFRPDDVNVDLAPGVRARVPLRVYANDEASLPPPRGDLPAPPQGWRADPGLRATRLSAVAVLWTTLRHFYPYWDVTPTDWDAALVPALTDAALHDDPAVFHDDLSRLLAQIRDGHGGIDSTHCRRNYSLPLRCEFVGDDLIVVLMTRAAADAPNPPRPGDAVLAIDGRPIEELRSEAAARVCAAGEGWLKWRLAGELLLRESDAPVDVQVRRSDGSESIVTLTPRYVQALGALAEKRPRDGEQVSPGVFYFNLVGAETPALDAFLGAAGGARAMVFDMRGYPSSAGKALLAHLADQNLNSALWRVPVITRPGYEGVTFHESRWDDPPQPPRITARVVFMTDGSAISYAESCMGIVEAYRLGEIVGSPTAGSNGNVVGVSLPGGYSARWTGMQVLKHDRSRHHGVGILPTVPAARTVEGIRAGRDEVLEKAIEVAGMNAPPR